MKDLYELDTKYLYIDFWENSFKDVGFEFKIDLLEIEFGIKIHKFQLWVNLGRKLYL